MYSNLKWLEEQLTAVAESNHPEKSHLIRSLQNKIADIHLNCHLQDVEPWIYDQLILLDMQQLQTMVDAFIKVNLPVPNAVYQVLEDKKQQNTQLYLIKLLEKND